jgi:UDP-N-acetylmuramyl pentapeptide synthase
MCIKCIGDYGNIRAGCKTTLKNMLKNILQLKTPTLATKGNLNNHLGVPMTLLRLAY